MFNAKMGKVLFASFIIIIMYGIRDGGGLSALSRDDWSSCFCFYRTFNMDFQARLAF